MAKSQYLHILKINFFPFQFSYIRIFSVWVYQWHRLIFTYYITFLKRVSFVVANYQNVSMINAKI